MRKTKREIMAGFTRPDEIEKSKFIAANTVGIWLKDGSYIVRLHETNIITRKGNIITLDSGGWQTPVTKDRMNIHSPGDVNIIQDKRVWYVVMSENPWGDEGKTRYPFYDGIRIDLETKEIVSRTVPDRTKEIQAVRWHIAEYAKLIDKLDKFPMPASHDCWDCCMKTKKGIPMGDMRGRTTKDVHDILHSHLMLHITEGYLHGSIVVNAWMDKHGNKTTIGIMMNSPNWFNQLKPSIRRYLRGYIGDRLIPLIQNGNFHALDWLESEEEKRAKGDGNNVK